MTYKFPREDSNSNNMIPQKVSDEIKDFGTRLGAITVGFVYGAVGIILIVIIWLITAYGLMTWKGALVLTIVILFFLYGSILLYRTTIEYAIADGLSKINTELDLSMDNIIENIIKKLIKKELKDDASMTIEELESSVEE